jgi:hypothetical protein
MPKEMSRSEKPDFFAKGGNTKMFGKGTAHTALSDVSGKSDNGGTAGSEPADKPYEHESYTDGVRYQEGGGSNEMFGKGHSGKKIPGISGKETQEG